MRKHLLASLWLGPVLLVSSVTCCGQSTSTKTPVAIINPKHPVDSRGEVVYSAQSVMNEDIPAVSGTFILPKLINSSINMEFPKNYRKEEPYPHVSVMGVVATNGDFIDLEIVESTGIEASKNALVAAASHKFHPATLDGKPVAWRLMLDFSF